METQLHRLVKAGGYINNILYQITIGVDVNAKDLCSFTALHYAVYYHYLDIAELLLKNGADIESENLYNDTPLRMAAKADFLDMVILLLKYSANVNGCRKLGVHTPLHAVVKESGYIPVLEYLITHGADVNVVQEYG